MAIASEPAGGRSETWTAHLSGLAP